MASIENSLLESDDERKDNFYIFKRYEISKLANKIFSKPLYFFVVIVMVCYLYICLTSNAVITGGSLLRIISRSIGRSLPQEYYQLIVGTFFAIAILISLNNINKLKKFSMAIMICRFIIIFLIIGSCAYSIATYGVSPISEIPLFNIKNITTIIGNALFCFMTHHSMPGMVEGFNPQKKLIKFLILAYIISLCIMVSFGFLSILAFAQFKSCDVDQFPAAIQVKCLSNRTFLVWILWHSQLLATLSITIQSWMWLLPLCSLLPLKTIFFKRLVTVSPS